MSNEEFRDNADLDYLRELDEAHNLRHDEGEYLADETAPTQEEQLFIDLQRNLTMAESSFHDLQRLEKSNQDDPDIQIQTAMAESQIVKKLQSVTNDAQSLHDRIAPEEQTKGWADRMKGSSEAERML